MNLKNRLAKIEREAPAVDKVTFIGWADCEWRECEGLTRSENESIDEFKKRVMRVTDKKFIWVQ